VLVLQTIYKHRVLFDEKRTMTDWAEELGYTKLTMTRAFRELRFILEDDEYLEGIRGRQLWDRLRPFLRTPVMRRRYYDMDLPTKKWALLAGDSALPIYTNMAEGGHKVVCMGGQRWKRFQEDYNPMELSRPEPGGLEIQIWRYIPKCLADKGVADPLSVYLSYEKNRDERVEMALEELLEGIQW
jgi:hypothetical protein